MSSQPLTDSCAAALRLQGIMRGPAKPADEVLLGKSLEEMSAEECQVGCHVPGLPATWAGLSLRRGGAGPASASCCGG